MQTAPIALFCYNRPNHLARCLHALTHNTLAQQSELFIFCDGAKSDIDAGTVAQTREVARSAIGFSRIHIREGSVNRGLASSLSNGISEVCERYGRVIVVEDDTVVSSSFLEYMNEALRRYEREEKVMQISGYMFSIDFGEPPRGFSCRSRQAGAGRPGSGHGVIFPTIQKTSILQCWTRKRNTASTWTAAIPTRACYASESMAKMNLGIFSVVDRLPRRRSRAPSFPLSGYKHRLRRLWNTLQ